MIRRAFYATHLRRIAILLAFTQAVLVAGTIGFRLIEGSQWFDSFYMALITVTTIGYGETIELSQGGRLFNSLLIFAGFLAVFVAIGVTTDTLIQLELQSFFSRKRTKRMINKMSGHFIVCGLGRVGRAVIERLQRSDAKIVAIDSDPSRESWALDHDVALLPEDATLDVTLARAGAQRARGLVAATSSDAVNVYITLSSRVLNPDLRIGARASDEESRQKLLQAGANTVFTPYTFTGFRIAQALLHPEVANFLDLATAVENPDFEVDIDEHRVGRRSRYAGLAVGTVRSQWGEGWGLILLALKAGDRPVQFNPPDSTRIEAGCVMIVMGQRHTLNRLKKELAD